MVSTEIIIDINSIPRTHRPNKNTNLDSDDMPLKVYISAMNVSS